MESVTTNKILLLIAHFAKMGNGDSLRSGHTQRDNEKEGGVVFVGIANSILWALCNSLIFFRSRTCRPLQLC
jgi:hypothetical protein